MDNRSRPLSVEGLTVSYGQREVLSGLSVDLEEGDIFGLMGPNGAGKTTLIRAICGRVEPRSGSLRVGGDTGKARLRHIGLAPQEIALYPYLTVRENLEVFGRLSGLSRQIVHERLPWASNATRVADRLDERVGLLSSGWKRRVNIAAAILHSPKLLILDEPTVGVDIEVRSHLNDVILELSGSGMAVLLATHDLDQAETLCNRVGFLRSGRLAVQGAPADLVREAFGGRKKIIIELRRPAGPQDLMLLKRIGFTPDPASRTWTLLRGDADHQVNHLGAALRKAGIDLREIRLREPGLDSLFRRVLHEGETAP